MATRQTSSVLAQLEDYRDRYQEKKRQNKVFYLINRVVVLTLGALIPVLTTIDAPDWVTAVVGACIVVVTGISQIFAPQERYIAFRIAFKGLERERLLFLACADPYGGDDSKAETALVMKIAEIVSSTEASVVSTAKKAETSGGSVSPNGQG